MRFCGDEHQPAVSVVICAFQSRPRIDHAIRSLRIQDLDEPFEVIAVISGNDGCVEHIEAAHPDIRFVYSKDRLFPGAARNLGIRRSRADVIAFLPDDGIAAPGWLRARLERHRDGFPLVAGAIANGTPRNLIGSACYYVEYTASMPVEGLLRRQPIPHTLSYRRVAFDEVGAFPELRLPGEDTIFNRRCVSAGLPVAYEPRAIVHHLNLTRFWSFLSHQHQHGRGLAHCVVLGELDGPFGRRNGRVSLALSTLVWYPALRWLRTSRLLAATAPRHLLPYLLLTPIVLTGYVAGGVGSWEQLRRGDVV